MVGHPQQSQIQEEQIMGVRFRVLAIEAQVSEWFCLSVVLAGVASVLSALKSLRLAIVLVS